MISPAGTPIPRQSVDEVGIHAVVIVFGWIIPAIGTCLEVSRLHRPACGRFTYQPAVQPLLVSLKISILDQLRSKRRINVSFLTKRRMQMKK